ncbi:MAG TPA: hypothetical protein VGE85_10455 [Terracidiphilus sp.]
MHGMHNTVLRRSALAVALFSIVAALGAQAQQWQAYSYPADGFTASFPGEPQFSKRDVPTEKGSFELRAYLAQDGQAALFVGVCDYGSAISDRTPDQVLQGAKQGAVDNVNAHLLREKAITLGAYPGVEFEAENDTMHFYARIYLVGSTLYQTLIASPLGTPYIGATRFLDSFHLIPRVSGFGSGAATP